MNEHNESLGYGHCPCDDCAKAREGEHQWARDQATLTPSPPAVGGVTEEAVEAALDVFKEQQTDDCDHTPTRMRAALTAALPFMREAVGVRALAWTKSGEFEWFASISPLFGYTIKQAGEREFYVTHPVGPRGTLRSRYESLQEAANDCDPHWQTYVRSLLVAADDGEAVAPVASAIYAPDGTLREVIPNKLDAERGRAHWDRLRPDTAPHVATPLYASPPPAPKVGDGFVRVPRVLAGRIAAYFHDGVDDESRYLARQWRNLAAAPAPVVAEACPDGLLPDGIECPRCHGKRAPSGIDGGTWVHIGERSDTAPERDPRNAPQVGDVCHSMYGTWTVVAKNHDGSLRCHVKDESAYSDRETTVPIENWQFKLYSDERWLTREQYAAEKEKGR